VGDASGASVRFPEIQASEQNCTLYSILVFLIICQSTQPPRDNPNILLLLLVFFLAYRFEMDQRQQPTEV